MKNWKKDSWRNCEIKHIPHYNDQDKLEEATLIINQALDIKSKLLTFKLN